MGGALIPLPPAVLFGIILILLILFYKKGYMPKGGGSFVLIALPLLGAAYYVFIFISHITIFAMETQYLEPAVMVASIERYGAPLMLGALMLITWLWIGGEGKKETDSKETDNAKTTDRVTGTGVVLRMLVFAAAVLVFGNIQAAYDGLIGYRSHLAEDMEARDAFIDEETEYFLEAVGESFPLGNVRVCRLRDGGYYRVADTYGAYEASPVSVISITFKLEETDEAVLIKSISETHGTYLYVDRQETDSSFLNEMTREGAFKYRTLYRIAYEDGAMVLYEL